MVNKYFQESKGGKESKMVLLKKSAFEDSFFLIIIIFALCIFILVLLTMWNNIKNPINEGINSSMPGDSNINISDTLNKTSETLIMFDRLIPFILIGLFAFCLIGASLYFNHPIMLIVGIIILAVAVMLSIIYSNIYHQISSSDSLSNANSSLQIGELFMKYLPFIVVILIIGVIALIIFSRQGGSNTL